MKASRLASWFTLVFTLGVCLVARVHAASYFIDFGPNVSPGQDTTGADAYGHYWNNFTGTIYSSGGIANGLTLSNLVNSSNVSSSLGIQTTSGGFLSNGGIGVTDLTGASLGDLGVLTATQDFFYTSGTDSLKITGLDSSKTYTFLLFGSRDIASTRVTQYTLTGGNGSFVSSLTTSGAGIGSGGGNANNNTVVSTSGITPDGNNAISLSLTVTTGPFAYINALEIIEVSPIPEPPTEAALIGAMVLGLAGYRRRRRNAG